MENTLAKFISMVQKPSVNEIFLRHQGAEYQICFAGRYIIVEDTVTGDAEEFCFAESGDALIQAFLDAAPRGITIRAILTELSGEELIATR